MGLNAPPVRAEIDIQRSSDGGHTWSSLLDNHMSMGIEAFSASGTECEDSVIGTTADSSSLQQQRRVPFANPGSNSTQQTFMRFINPNSTSTQVEVYGIDDDGTPNRSGPISFTLDAQSSLQFTAQDMENGNTSKGLTGSFCDGSGKWQLIVRSNNSIEVMSLIRAPGGFLTSLNEVVPQSGNDRLVYFVNSASEPQQQTFLRILNKDATAGTVTISAIDDGGNAGDSDITLTLAANDSQQMTSQDLEDGNTDKGLIGALGDGEGNWRLTITSTLDLDVLGLIRLPGGYLLNLSAIAPGTGNTRELNYVEPADETLRTSLLRVINTSNNVATYTVSATDDDGQPAPSGDATFTLDPLAAREIPVSDLESGNVSDGISGMLGDGSGRWRMTISSTDTLEVMSLIETPDGFLTNLSRAAPASGTDHEILVFNPGSNTDRRSTVRIANDGDSQAAITISGYDDTGAEGDSEVRLNLSAGRSISITALDLENGNSDLGLTGALGDGEGKWRLTVSSSEDIQVQGTLDTPAGFITNLSRATEGETTEPLPTGDSLAFFEESVSPILQSKCVVCHVSGGVADASGLHYVSSSTSGYIQTNYDTLSRYINSGNSDTLLNKGRGVSHGGGTQFSSDSQEFSDLSTFIELLGEEVSASSNNGEYWEGVVMATPVKTLRRASMLLRGDLPTEAEEQAITTGGETALRGTIRGMMEGDGFHEFLTRGANDRILTDAFFNGFFDAADTNNTFFPKAATRNFEANVAAGGMQAEQDNLWRLHWGWGLARAPVELIAYVVEQDRNYQEVLTADYMMVNYLTNEMLNAGASFTTEDPAVFKPGQNNGQIFQDDLLISEYTQMFGPDIESHGPYIDYPQAGVLNTHAYLNRYPTTETNRNRARARWTYYHFLGVDIEKSAERTTDPEALADTDNPTLNNPACTACHSIHDPVAGTFQNYGNQGFYRDQYGGNDSLPDTYKYPESYDENADPSEYSQGDTWFRDMRTAGFEGQIAPDPDTSMQWVGQVISEDPRFATAAAKFWWQSLMGAPALVAPEVSEDADFNVRLAAYEAQNDFIETLGAEFETGIEGGAAYNGKDLLTAMMISPWFRADEVESPAVRARLVTELGTKRLLTPEELEKKSASLLGWVWGAGEPDPYLFDGLASNLGDRFKIYYGGIDSDGIVDRSTALTALMANVAEKQAMEMSCPAVMLDFERADSERLLFRGIEASTIPGTEIADEYTVAADNQNDPESFDLNGSLGTGNKEAIVYFENDWYDEELGDRNLVLKNITVRDSSNATVLSLDYEDINTLAGTSYGCGEPYEGYGFNLWSSCNVAIPFTVADAGTHTITVTAFGEQAGPDLIGMTITVNDLNPENGTSSSALAIKGVLINLHDRLLGQTLDIDDLEIEATYQLLVESWQARQTWIEEYGGWAYNWPQEECYFYLDEHWEEGGIGERGDDPTGMKNTWMSVLIYLMTDFAYLHE
jgi:hypothetical protein